MLIRASFEKSRRTYGSPRIHEDLVEANQRVGRNRPVGVTRPVAEWIAAGAIARSTALSSRAEWWRAWQREWGHSAPEAMIRKYSGDKKSIEARSSDNGCTWSVKLFDTGRLTEYTGGSLAEVDALAAKHGMKLDR